MIREQINWENMHLLDMPNSIMNQRTITITSKGEIVINAKFLEKMQVENPARMVDFYFSEDFRILAIRNNTKGNFKLPKTGRMKYMEFARKISKAGYILPIKYSVEWNETEKLWMAILQEKYVPLDTEQLVTSCMKQKRNRKRDYEN